MDGFKNGLKYSIADSDQAIICLTSANLSSGIKSTAIPDQSKLQNHVIGWLPALFAAAASIWTRKPKGDGAIPP